MEVFVVAAVLADDQVAIDVARTVVIYVMDFGAGRKWFPESLLSDGPVLEHYSA